MAFSSNGALSYEDENILGFVDHLKKKSQTMAEMSDQEVIDFIFSMVHDRVGSFEDGILKNNINKILDLSSSIGLIDHSTDFFREEEGKVIPTDYLINFFVRPRR